MSLLSKATSGIIHTPMMYVIFGPPGVGKTSFAASFPSPLVADIENGSNRIKNATRLGADQLPDFASLMTLATELLTTQHSYKTLIIDSVTALEKYVEAAVLVDEKVTSIKDVPWGGGDVKVREKLQTLVAKTKELQTKKGMEVIYVAHTQVKAFTDPHLNATYDRNVLQCGDKFAHILVSSADNVFFCKYNVTAVTDKNKSKSKAFGDGSRVMFTEQRPSFDAKNRLSLPFTLALDYKAYVEAIELVAPKPSEDLKKDIGELLKLASEETQKLVTEAVLAAKDDQVKLIRIKAKLLTMVNA